MQIMCMRFFIWMGSESANAADCKSAPFGGSGLDTHPIHSLKLRKIKYGGVAEWSIARDCKSRPKGTVVQIHPPSLSIWAGGRVVEGGGL